MAVVSKNALKHSSGDVDFHKGKLHIMKFYFNYELPKMNSLAETLKSEVNLTTDDKVLKYF